MEIYTYFRANKVRLRSLYQMNDLMLKIIPGTSFL